MNSSIIRTLALAAASALLWACNEGTGSTTESGVVTGRLLTSGKVPVAGAAVSVIPVDHVPSLVLKKASAAGEAVTDAQGNYRIENVPAGLYNISAAKDSLTLFKDSLPVTAAGAAAGVDTLRKSGSMQGLIVMEPGDDSRTVLILVLGTNALAFPRDTSGSFSLSALAEGEYHVRFLSTIGKYRPLDTLIRIRSGHADTLAHPVRLRYTGIRAVAGLVGQWDADRQSIVLTWQAADSALIAGYNLYRSKLGAPMGSIPLNTVLITAASYRDTGIKVGEEYAYAVKAVDKDGNVGEKASNAVPVSAVAAYTLVKKLTPRGFTLDDSPLAVSNGEIYWLEGDRVDVFDTAGVMNRSFGFSGAGALTNAFAIRVYKDTVFVVENQADHGAPAKDMRAFLRKYSKQGAFLGSRTIDGVFNGDNMAAADFLFGPDGTLYMTNAASIYSLSPAGLLASTPSPLDPELQNPFSKLEPIGDRMLLMGSMGNLTLNVNTTQLALLNRDLSLASLDSTAYFLNAYAADDAGKLWIVRDDNVAEAMSPTDMQVSRRIALPKGLYRDIQVEGETVYLYDASANAILIYRNRRGAP
jgi:hypothetical protein